jgi:hypothetical protein
MRCNRGRKTPNLENLLRNSRHVMLLNSSLKPTIQAFRAFPLSGRDCFLSFGIWVSMRERGCSDETSCYGQVGGCRTSSRPIQLSTEMER